MLTIEQGRSMKNYSNKNPLSFILRAADVAHAPHFSGRSSSPHSLNEFSGVKDKTKWIFNEALTRFELVSPA